MGGKWKKHDDSKRIEFPKHTGENRFYYTDAQVIASLENNPLNVAEIAFMDSVGSHTALKTLLSKIGLKRKDVTTYTAQRIYISYCIEYYKGTSSGRRFLNWLYARLSISSQTAQDAVMLRNRDRHPFPSIQVIEPQQTRNQFFPPKFSLIDEEKADRVVVNPHQNIIKSNVRVLDAEPMIPASIPMMGYDAENDPLIQHNSSSEHSIIDLSLEYKKQQAVFDNAQETAAIAEQNIRELSKLSKSRERTKSGASSSHSRRNSNTGNESKEFDYNALLDIPLDQISQHSMNKSTTMTAGDLVPPMPVDSTLPLRQREANLRDEFGVDVNEEMTLIDTDNQRFTHSPGIPPTQVIPPTQNIATTTTPGGDDESCHCTCHIQ